MTKEEAVNYLWATTTDRSRLVELCNKYNLNVDEVIEGLVNKYRESLRPTTINVFGLEIPLDFK